jgi:hypothetical protein
VEFGERRAVCAEDEVSSGGSNESVKGQQT